MRVVLLRTTAPAAITIALGWRNRSITKHMLAFASHVAAHLIYKLGSYERRLVGT